MSKNRSFIIKSWIGMLVLCLAFWAIIGFVCCSKANATPIDGVFKTIKQRMDIDANCKTPTVWYSSTLIMTICQKHALSGNRALSCYVPARNVIILPDRCKTSDDNECKRLTNHELAWAAYTCKGIQFDNPKPDEILQMEDINHD